VPCPPERNGTWITADAVGQELAGRSQSACSDKRQTIVTCAKTPTSSTVFPTTNPLRTSKCGRPPPCHANGTILSFPSGGGGGARLARHTKRRRSQSHGTATVPQINCHNSEHITVIHRAPRRPQLLSRPVLHASLPLHAVRRYLYHHHRSPYTLSLSSNHGHRRRRDCALVLRASVPPLAASTAAARRGRQCDVRPPLPHHRWPPPPPHLRLHPLPPQRPRGKLGTE
jgi:hypothetical protein